MDEHPQDDPTLLADGFEGAFLGYIERCGQPPVAIYDKDKAIEILMNEGMTDEEALEHFYYNVVGGWVGYGTPGFVERCSLKEFNEYMQDA